MALVAAAACNQGDSLGADAGPDVSPPAQLDLPGIVAWLDGDVGIDASRPDLMTWTDRSSYNHVFVAQTVLYGDMPAIAQLNGHQAVQFNGRNRFVSEAVPSASQMDALTLGDTFTVALVFVPARPGEVERRPTSVSDPDPTTPSVLAMAVFPWLPAPPQMPTTVVPPLPSFVVMTDGDGSLSFQAPSSDLHAAGTFAPTAQRLIMSTGGQNGPRVLLNGQLQAGTVTPVGTPSHGAYAPIYLGAWDFDWWGFQGAVAEMIVARGADEATEQALDGYLEAKFSL